MNDQVGKRGGSRIYVSVDPGFKPADGCALGGDFEATIDGKRFEVQSRGRVGPDGCEPAWLVVSETKRAPPEDRIPPGFHWNRVRVRDSSLEASLEVRELDSFREWDSPSEPSLVRFGQEVELTMQPHGDDLEGVPMQVCFMPSDELCQGVADDGGIEVVSGDYGTSAIRFRAPESLPANRAGTFHFRSGAAPMTIRNCKNAECSGNIWFHYEDGYDGFREFVD
ncbi:hypothetical protein [Vulgatibacter incomptus]|uniref:hypothetical protein n=1 Tax=Vulgatibacter incomptus TaxID=1391653 RepID=UPI00067FF35E|nr:hypothetical protein [Vulgatibacter incomptus]